MSDEAQRAAVLDSIKNASMDDIANMLQTRDAELDRLRPLAEAYVDHLEAQFEASNDDGAKYHYWQDALQQLEGSQ